MLRSLHSKGHTKVTHKTAHAMCLEIRKWSCYKEHPLKRTTYICSEHYNEISQELVFPEGRHYSSYGIVHGRYHAYIHKKERSYRFKEEWGPFVLWRVYKS